MGDHCPLHGRSLSNAWAFIVLCKGVHCPNPVQTRGTRPRRTEKSAELRRFVYRSNRLIGRLDGIWTRAVLAHGAPPQHHPHHTTNTPGTRAKKCRAHQEVEANSRHFSKNPTLLTACSAPVRPGSAPVPCHPDHRPTPATRQPRKQPRNVGNMKK